ncbi:MAG: ABC transporter permease subunit [Burkholderiales bacterium]
MASAAPVIAAPRAGASVAKRVLALRVAMVTVALGLWEAVAMSGLLFRDVVPSLQAMGRALLALLVRPDFYANLGVTLVEIVLAVAIGGALGLAVGIVLGARRFLSDAYESLLLYLGPTPKIVFFPVMLMWFGTGAGSKIALGALSCFFPVAISVAAGMRGIDPVLIRVGRSFRAPMLTMVKSIYLPAMRQPVVNGFRLGLGVAIIATLLAETKLSNQGVGYLIIQAYATFDMPRMYALLIVLFVLAIGANAVLGRLGRDDRRAIA